MRLRGNLVVPNPIRVRWRLGVAWLCVVSASCLVGDDKCDEHQVIATGSAYQECACAPGYVLSPKGYGCVACAEHEEVQSDKCVCSAGYARSSDSAPCEAIEGTAIGSECSDATDCGDPNPYCAEREAAPYCTTPDCTRNDDCPKDWRCSTTSEPRFCQRPPSGYGQACTSGADCSDTESPYCESFMTHICMVNDCVVEPNKCPSRSVCCDLSALIGTSLCVPSSQLSDGKCFGGTEPVRP